MYFKLSCLLKTTKYNYCTEFFNNSCDLPLSGQSATTLYVPGVVLDGSEIEMLRYLGCRHRAFHILLVGKYQYGCFSEVLKAMKTHWVRYKYNFATLQHVSIYFFSCLIQAFEIQPVNTNKLIFTMKLSFF